MVTFIILFISCRKESVNSYNTQDTEQQWSEQIYKEMKKIYYWNNVLPQTFDSRKYATAKDALTYLISLKIDAETNEPIDRYSFLDEIGNLEGQIFAGTPESADYGFNVRAAFDENRKISFYVIYAYKESPAGLQGIERGFKIVKVNGSDDVHPTLQSTSYLNTSSSGYQRVINALFYSTSATFTLRDGQGVEKDYTLSTSSYRANSVLFDTVFARGSKKIGYIVFNEFITSSVDMLKRSIRKFEDANVKHLIVDLRYNGGGSVAVNDTLSNLIAPPASNGSILYKYKYNDILSQSFKDKIVRIAKSGSLSLESIYFLVSSNTASASELLINSFVPHFRGNLFLVGSTTFGKPVGFWATPIGYTVNQKEKKEGYDLYAVSFETINSEDVGGYFRGISPGTSYYPGLDNVPDDIMLQWGDVNDPRLNQALFHCQYGLFRPLFKSDAIEIKGFPRRRFIGMVDYSLPDRK